jgi:hypothetical protein
VVTAAWITPLISLAHRAMRATARQRKAIPTDRDFSPVEFYLILLERSNMAIMDINCKNSINLHPTKREVIE